MAGDSIKFNASLNTAAFESGAKKLQGVAAGAASGISQHFGKIAMAVAGITAAFLGVRAAAQSFNAAIAMGGQLNDLSARTGETAGNLAILQRAFQNAGAGAEAVGPTINRLQRAIVEAGEGSKTYAAAFTKLGLDLDALKTKTPTEQLRAVAEAIKGIENPSEQTAIAMQILGRSGGELMPLLKAMGGEFDRAGQQLGSLPGIIDRTNEHLDRIGDNFKAIGEKGKEFMVGLLERLAPGLADLTDRLANIDAAGFGAKLSEYAQKTVAWITETFKLKDALNQMEVAIGGITSGNFGDGLNLMFLTARDTALNAINNIVAAAGAAVETIVGAVSKMFRADGPLLHLLKTSFTIGANYFKEVLMTAMASVLENFGPWGKKIAAVMRYEAETAAEFIKMQTKGIGAQIDLVGEDAKATFAAIPKEFARSYEQNMKAPLFEMPKRAAETADQMERVAAATRAAAFDAERFGQALRDAQIDKFAGDSPDSPFPANTRGGGAAMPASAPEAAAPSGGASTGGGGSLGGGTSRTRGNSMRDLAAQGNEDARTEMLRSEAEQRRYQDRINRMIGEGHFRPAARAMGAADRAAERREDRFRGLQNIREQGLGRNMGEAYSNFRSEFGLDADRLIRDRLGDDFDPTQGMQENFKKMAEQYQKSESERKKEEEAGQAPGGGKGGGSDIINDIYTLLKQHLPEIDEKLPLNALGAGE